MVSIFRSFLPQHHVEEVREGEGAHRARVDLVHQVLGERVVLLRTVQIRIKPC